MIFSIIELGHYALILALVMMFLQTLLGFFGAYAKELNSIAYSVRAVKVGFYLTTVSLVALAVGFLQNDFSVKYIASNSNAYLPWYYKVSAVWSNHEGSLLLWAWILALWNYLVAVKATHLPPSFRGKVFGVLGVISAGFFSFLILTSNPFERLLPGTAVGGFPLIGEDLNPLLHDIGLILHPPLLYVGYVGFSVSFAFIVAALLEGRLDTAWARWCRPWTMMAWSFLTLGIALGSWWAYYELGWGGWWFWDPVENASLMPWLAGTALIHCLAATEKRDVFKIWTAFLAISTFSLSLIGTFLVRSGVLTSVHAFANDPTRGIYILALLVLISGSAFLLLILRAHRLHGTGRFEWVSREMGLLLNNLLLCAACLIVFIGTLAPLFYDVLDWGQISVGPAYFNQMMLYVFVITLVFLMFAPYLHWKRNRLARFVPMLLIAAVFSLGLSALINAPFASFSWLAFALTALTLTAVLSTGWDAYQQSYRTKTGWRLPSKGYLAMLTGHLGFLVMSLGIILVSSYAVEIDRYVRSGETVEVGDYNFEMKGLSNHENKIYSASRIDFLVRDAENNVVGIMSPEKRQYEVSQMPTAESALRASLTEDIYVALGEPQDAGAWSVRFQIKPYIRWVWLGALIMSLATVFVLRDRRYRLKQSQAVS
ncbi:heme lyase CcmF/NrfE family subunit [Ostreibacterium oceani]|uniref:Heme lyase CcmF/NrfE family subunit n=1 Tax=Ostreibacterium oceani TaxID=2654998 RepID=A0A6N7ETZ4_9GAMM|nr:heme lyase CcmF/NrfE family subunit [Ostreibacterium oceani]MPV86021.1 heme lyase CcmF/NrfE family subunit [Ostreibacterium oceani]